MSAVIENHHDDHHHGPAKGLTRWLYTTNHKDIGTLYLWFSFAMFLIGGAMALVIRAELFQPADYPRACAWSCVWTLLC
jgi:cytochrome c oxidase subunit 1